MRILLTNNTLDHLAGSELYLRDVAVELMRRGHRPVAYSTKLGKLAELLRSATVPVISSLDTLGDAPDIIHGHHHYETQTALLRFPGTPAIYYCHGWAPWQEATLRSPQIRRYVAVDELCRERLIAEGGIAPTDIELIQNFFDERLFPPRGPLPQQPRLAMAYGNDFTEEYDLPRLREACARHGIELHSAGIGSNQHLSDPGPRLVQYDIVFARARSAIEAMAVGAAVILCSFGKLGPMVTTSNFHQLRKLNFGIRTLSETLTCERVSAELSRYDAADAATVSATVRCECEMKPAVDRLLSMYAEVIDRAKAAAPPSAREMSRAASQYLERWAPLYKEGAALGELLQRQHQRTAALVQELNSVQQKSTQQADASAAKLQAVTLRLGEVEDELARSQFRCADLQRSLKDSELKNSTVETELSRWRSQHSALKQDSEELSTRLASAEQSLHDSRKHAAIMERRLATIRASATWRWSRTVLENPFVRFLFGGIIRSVARRAVARQSQ